MMNLIALLLVLTGTANIDATGYLHQEILIIRNYNNNNDGLKKVKDAAKVQLNSEWIYEVIVSPKMPTRISALPSNKLPGQKSEKFLLGILGETMTS